MRSAEIGLLKNMAKTMLLAAILFACPCLSLAEGDREPYHKAFTVYWENDSFTGTDRDYSNGLKLTWSKGYTPSQDKKRSIKRWMFEHLPLMNEPEARRATSFFIGQNIYTPEDTDRADLVTDDRPYAGYSYIGFGFITNTGVRRDVWEFEIGIVGPSSKAKATQDLVHEALDVDRARGWDNQLENELGLNLTYESKWRLGHYGSSRGFSADVIPHLGGRIGNIAIYANAGAEFRFGWSVPEDFGTCPIRPGCNTSASFGSDPGYSRGGRTQFGIYLFIATDGRAVLRDIFLDGNTFQDSHSVDKEPLVLDLMGGIAMHYGRFRLNYALVRRTKEFEERDDNHTFGTVSLSYLY